MAAHFEHRSAIGERLDDRADIVDAQSILGDDGAKQALIGAYPVANFALEVRQVRFGYLYCFALVGNGLVIVGVAIVLWSVTATSVAGFFVGTVIAGAGFGAGFQGGLRTIVTLAGPAERAGVISVAYIICYLAMGLPAILAGFLVVNSTVTRTAQEFGITVIALAAFTAFGTILSARRVARQRCLSPSPAK